MIDISGVGLIGAAGGRSVSADGGMERRAEMVVDDPVVDPGGVLVAVEPVLAAVDVDAAGNEVGVADGGAAGALAVDLGVLDPQAGAGVVAVGAGDDLRLAATDL